MNMKDLKKQLMSQVDENDKIAVEKVERYIELVELNKKMSVAIRKYGPVVEIENGPQRFIKPNPAIAEKLKINRVLIALGKDLELDDDGKIVTSIDEEYSEDDLIS